MKKHVEEEHKETLLYGKRKKTDLNNVNFDDDSDEDEEHIPVDDNRY